MCLSRLGYRLRLCLREPELDLIRQVIRYGSVGGLATLLHVCIAIVLRESAELSPLQANFSGFMCATMLSYLGHSLFTFSRAIRQADQFARFLVAGLVSLGSSTFLVWFLSDRMSVEFTLAMLAVGAIVPMLTYLVLRFWVFGEAGVKKRTDWSAIALCGIMALSTVTLFWDRPINHDTAWYLVATREWLGGAKLYIDLIEVNPPLNFYFTLPAIGISNILQISDKNAMYVAVSLLIFAVANWSRHIVLSEFGFDARRATALCLAIFVALIVPAMHEFGQREHLLVILTLPWLLGEATREPKTRTQDISRAAVATLGICLKPHFIVIPLAISALKVVQQRSLLPVFSVANLTFLTSGVAYVSYVALIHPAYFSDIVPMAHEIYGAYRAPLNIVILKAYIPILLLSTLILGMFATQRFNGLHTPLLAAAVASLMVYLLQGTGFHYHTIPFKSFAIIACIIIVLTSLSRDVFFFVSIAACTGLVVIETDRGFYKSSIAQQLVNSVKAIGAVERLMVFTTHVSLGPAVAMESGAEWTSRYPANWLVPGAINRLGETNCADHPALCSRLESYAARNRSDNISDIRRHSPDLIVIDRRSGYFSERPFSWLHFMQGNPTWIEILSEYGLVKTTDAFFYFKR